MAYIDGLGRPCSSRHSCSRCVIISSPAFTPLDWLRTKVEVAHGRAFSTRYASDYYGSSISVFVHHVGCCYRHHNNLIADVGQHIHKPPGQARSSVGIRWSAFICFVAAWKYTSLLSSKFNRLVSLSISVRQFRQPVEPTPSARALRAAGRKWRYLERGLSNRPHDPTLMLFVGLLRHLR